MYHNTIFTKMTNKVQQCRIIYCSLTALHVSGNIIAHHQERLNCNYSFWFYSRVSSAADSNVSDNVHHLQYTSNNLLRMKNQRLPVQF